MPNKLRQLERRLDLLEQEIVRLRQRLGVSSVPEGAASHAVDLDATLDRFFESAGIQGELSGLAQLRALQAEHERLWGGRQKNGASLRPGTDGSATPEPMSGSAATANLDTGGRTDAADEVVGGPPCSRKPSPVWAGAPPAIRGG